VSGMNCAFAYVGGCMLRSGVGDVTSTDGVGHGEVELCFSFVWAE